MKTNYTATIDYFNIKDSGRFGKAFEINVKQYLNGGRGNSSKVTLKGKADVHFHGLRLEIKSNCGEINDDFMKNDYIVYTMDNKTAYDEPELAIVVTPKEFINILNNLGLIRTKKATNGYTKTAIQSYSNSKKKTVALANALARCMTLKDWKACH